MSPEGVVLGADSTASMAVDATSLHFFNHTQKVYEIGEPGTGTLAIVMWGMAAIDIDVSHRTSIALLADELKKTQPKTVSDVATLWIDRVWDQYVNTAEYKRFTLLKGIPAYTTTPSAGVTTRSEAEDNEFANLGANLVLGFCIAGYIPGKRTPEAAVINVDPHKGKPAPQMTQQHALLWFGFPGIFERVANGIDSGLRRAILDSRKWSGTEPELDDLVFNCAN